MRANRGAGLELGQSKVTAKRRLRLRLALPLFSSATEAGTQYSPGTPWLLDPRIRGDDERVDMIRTKETLN